MLQLEFSRFSLSASQSAKGRRQSEYFCTGRGCIRSAELCEQRLAERRYCAKRCEAQSFLWRQPLHLCSSYCARLRASTWQQDHFLSCKPKGQCQQQHRSTSGSSSCSPKQQHSSRRVANQPCCLCALLLWCSASTVTSFLLLLLLCCLKSGSSGAAKQQSSSGGAVDAAEQWSGGSSKEQQVTAQPSICKSHAI